MGKGRYADQIPAEMQASFERVLALRGERNFGAARALLATLLQQAPDHPRFLNELGNIHYREGDFAGAEELFRRVLALRADDEAAAASMCMLCARAGRQDEANEYAAQIIAARPEFALTWYTLGAVFAHRRDWPKALKYSLAACAMDDALADAHYNAACAYAQMGNGADALRHLEAGLNSGHLLHLAATDADLAPIRNLPAFEEVLARARARLGK